ncbi:MAG TPA: polysaccharide pyruvyl transferase family protein, partial [Anaerolineales bacterium]|nr:polysaccharide pyruvyl transferase family protein [Anaerolineales bacterium]
MRRILIAGYYGFGNAGDEAVLGGMLHDLRGRDPNVEFVVVSGETSATREQHGVQAVAWTDVAGLVTAARSSDLLVLGGGGLFHDYWDVRLEDVLAPRFCGLASYAGIPLLARLLDRPCMLYGVGVGPLNSEAGKTLTRSAFEVAQLATVRDRASIEALKATGLANDLIDERVFLTADPAFGLPADTADAARLWLGNEGVPQGEPLMGVCLRPWDFGADQEHWVQQIARALDRWLAEWGGRALLLPFQSRLMSRYEDDVAIARSIVGQMMGTARCTIVGSPLSPALTAAVLGQCSVVLAMRLHAVAFALRSGVPVVAMAYDPKVASLMKDAGLEQLTLQRGEWLAPSLVHRLDL